MVVAQHALVGAHVKVVIVLGELAVADRLVLVHDASDLHHCSSSHPLSITLELYYFHLGV